MAQLWLSKVSHSNRESYDPSMIHQSSNPHTCYLFGQHSVDQILLLYLIQNYFGLSHMSLVKVQTHGYPMESNDQLFIMTYPYRSISTNNMVMDNLLINWCYKTTSISVGLENLPETKKQKPPGKYQDIIATSRHRCGPRTAPLTQLNMPLHQQICTGGPHKLSKTPS